ncbi:MAG: cytochrome c peroxidase [Chloroflexota bacterium]
MMQREGKLGSDWGHYAALVLIFLLLILLPAAPSSLSAQTGATATPLPLFALPDSRNRAYVSNTIAIASDARTMVAANMINNSMTILIPAFDRVIAEVPVGIDPRSVAITPDATRALVANHGDGTLSVVSLITNEVIATIPLGGVLPYGVVANHDTTAYVSLEGSDQIAVVDLVAGRVSSTISVPDAPAGLTLWGDFLYVTHFWSGEISLIYLPQERVIQTVSTGSDTALFQNLEPDVTRGIAYLPQTRLNAQNPALTYDTAAFPVINVVNMRDLATVRERRVALDTADRPVNMPFAAALDRFAQRLYVANAGSDSISVIDLNTGAARAHIAVGANPRGILLNGDNTLLYVHSVLDGTITTIDTRTLTVSDVRPIINLSVSLDLLLGAQLFHSASDPRLSAGNSLSCATCHFDGQSDGRVWQGFPDGPRNTPLFYNLPETVPYKWSASWDELADVETKIHWLQAGTGLIETLEEAEPHPGMSVDLDLLTQYLITLQAPPNPYQLPADVIERGSEVFAAEGCVECHVGPAGTGLQSYDVGTGASPLERLGSAFDTPSLRWLWLSAPYFHNGSAQTLRQVFELPGTHQLIFDVPPEDIDALISYLLSLGT